MKDGIVYGIGPVREALKGRRKGVELFVGESRGDRRTDEILALARSAGVPVRIRRGEDLLRLSGTPHHQGVVLRVEPFPYADLESLPDDADLVVVLDCIQDPHNLGAIIRSAACAGAAMVVIPKDRTCPVTPAVEKSSAGAVETIPVARVTNLADSLERLKERGFWVYGADAAGDLSLYGVRFPERVALVIGSEGEGIRPLVRKRCDGVVSIPLTGGVASLNASVAAGIVLFEIVRQRRGGS